jgi:phage gpG-like protein
MVKVEVKSSGKNIVVFGNKIDIGKQLQQKLSDKGLLKKDLNSIAFLIRDKIKKNISSGVRYDTGGRVVKLAKSTIDRKGSSVPLIDTGKMLSSVVVAKEDNKVIVRMKNVRYPKLSTSKKSKPRPTVSQVAKWVNEGTDNMPSRPFFGITKKDATMFTKLVLKERFNI